jgi:hypothetical protein
MNAGVGHESLLKRQTEKGSMRNLGLFGNASSQNPCWPGVDVCIKMDDRDGPINLMKRSKNGKHLGDHLTCEICRGDAMICYLTMVWSPPTKSCSTNRVRERDRDS